MKYKSKKGSMYLIFIVFGVVGVAFGAVVANKSVCGSYINTIQFLKNVGLDLEDITLSGIFYLKNFFIHYILFVLVIWLFGFTALAVYTNTIILFFRGFIYGYTISRFFIDYRFVGIMIFVISYMFPALIFLPILFEMTYTSIQYSINKYNYFSIVREKKRYNDMGIYIRALIVSALGLFVVLIMQMYMINPIIQKIGF